MEEKEIKRRQLMEEQRWKRREEARRAQEEHDKKIREAHEKSDMALEETKRMFELKQQENEDKRRAYQIRRRKSLDMRREEAERKSQEIQRKLEDMEARDWEKRQGYKHKFDEFEKRKEENMARSMRESSMRKSELDEAARKRQEAYDLACQTREENRMNLLKDIQEKNNRSEIAKRKHDQAQMERRYREFITSQDKKFNVDKIARQNQYKRDQLNKRLIEENNRAIRIRNERNEIMQTKQKLRRDIDRDKQAIIHDFEMVNQGKVDPSVIAKKYGYTAPPPEEDNRGNYSSRGYTAPERNHSNTGSNYRPQQSSNNYNRPNTNNNNYSTNNYQSSGPSYSSQDRNR